MQRNWTMNLLFLIVNCLFEKRLCKENTLVRYIPAKKKRDRRG